MIIAVLKEAFEYEKRVAASPDTVKKFHDLGYEIAVEKNAGINSGFEDSSYIASGAKIAASMAEAVNKADIILKINAPSLQELKHFPENAVIICNFSNLAEEAKPLLTEKKFTAFALERIPRISRAQNMDILSSQDNLAGYKAVIEAVNRINSAVPMMTTSAGSIAPAKIFILGIGVAGLQAIATAKRLGAIVYASDVRPETKEQAESLGGKFVETAEVNEMLTKMNIIITAAGAAGKAPKLIKSDTVKTLSPNTLILDLVGNVEGLSGKETKSEGNVTLVGDHYLASEVSQSSSRLFANNIFNFMNLLFGKDSQRLNLNFEDEIIKATCISYEGEPRW